MNVGNSILAIRIQNNVRSLSTTMQEHTEKLASGIRINRAADDAAGLKISEKMRSQIRGLEMSIDNATDGISMLQTADGGLSAIGELLQRMNELSIKAVNGVHTQDDLDKISIEYEQCKKEIDRIAETTTFNGKKLLNINTGVTKVEKGTSVVGNILLPANAKDKIDFSTIGDGNEFIVKKDDEEYRFLFTYSENQIVPHGSVKVKLTGKETNREKAEKLEEAIEDTISGVKANIYNSYPDDGKNYTIAVTSLNLIDGEKIELSMEADVPIIKVGNNQDDRIFLNFKSVTANDLDVKNTSVLTAKDAQEATKKINQAIENITTHRANLGTTQNQLENAIKRVTIEQENTTASESRIRDIDMAKEMVKYAKNQIIQQTAISMLSQANQSGISVLSLLSNNYQRQ